VVPPPVLWAASRRLPGRGELSFNPATYLIPDASPAAIERDAAYALSVCEWYLRHLPGGPATLDGATVLEVGPGCNLGSSLLLACLGATVQVTARYPTPWDSRYHPRLYRALHSLVSDRQPQWHLELLTAVLDQQAHEPMLRCMVSSLESLVEVADASIDVMVSNAVLEHTYDLVRAVSEMARVIRPGGLGLHQVDHRDHRFPERPLELLTVDDHQFEQLFTMVHGECGNRWRPHELEALFAEQGFEVLGVDISKQADPAYVKELCSRLGQAEGSRYRHLTPQQLMPLSVFYTVRRR
jgi:SAM-dependent methyltransferase